MKHGTSYDAITEQLLVGAYPQTPEAIRWLREEEGVTGVLNLQSDRDLYRRGIHWQAMWRMYTSLGMEVLRVPITDMDPQDFEKNLNEAVRQLSHLCGRHKKVYVHCNVGINRSLTAILAYLIFTGMEFEEAQRALRARRECIPYVDVVKRWSEGKRAG